MKSVLLSWRPGPDGPGGGPRFTIEQVPIWETTASSILTVTDASMRYDRSTHPHQRENWRTKALGAFPQALERFDAYNEKNHLPNGGVGVGDAVVSPVFGAGAHQTIIQVVMANLENRTVSDTASDMKQKLRSVYINALNAAIAPESFPCGPRLVPATSIALPLVGVGPGGDYDYDLAASVAMDTVMKFFKHMIPSISSQRRSQIQEVFFNIPTQEDLQPAKIAAAWRRAWNKHIVPMVVEWPGGPPCPPAFPGERRGLGSCG